MNADTPQRATAGQLSGRIQSGPASPRYRLLSFAACLAIVFTTGACTQRGAGDKQTDRNDLSAMSTAVLKIKDQPFLAWLAVTPTEHEYGLMHVNRTQLEPAPPDPANGLPDGAQRGMLFVFDDEKPRMFWMANTITSLDIAYIRTDGTIFKILTMPALKRQLHPSGEPARFALEVRAGLFSELGIQKGDRVEIPPEVFKPAD